MNTAEAWLAAPEDAADVARLLIGFRDHMGKSWPGDAAFRAGVERLMGDPMTEFVLGRPAPGAPPAGVIALRFRDSLWTSSTDCLLEDVFVDEAARGAGLGRVLVAFALDRARARGCRRAELDVNETNTPALALYTSLGFGKKATPWEGRDLFINIVLEDAD